MGRKIEDYANNVSANPDVNSLFDLSEKLGATYESRKWTLEDFLDWLNNNVNTNSIFIFNNSTGANLKAGDLVVLDGSTAGGIPVVKLLQSSKDLQHSKVFVLIENLLNGANGSFAPFGSFTIPVVTPYNVGDALYWDTINEQLTTFSNDEDSIFAGIVTQEDNVNNTNTIFFAPDKDPSTIYSPNSTAVALFNGTKSIVGNSNFQYVNNINTEVGFRITDAPNNNLTQLGVGYLNVETEGLSQNSATRLANWSNDANLKGLLSFRKSRGTKATPTQVLINDVLGSIIFTGQAIKGFDDGFNPPTFTPSGMTTAEIVVRAMQNFSKSYTTLNNETNSTGLTQYEIWLQQANAVGFGDFTPPNIKVFAVDGNGVVYFKDYSFPTGSGTNGQVLTSNGAGQVVWGNPSSGGVTGTGTDNYMTKWTTAGSVLGNSQIWDDGTQIKINYSNLGVNNFAKIGLISTEQKGIFIDATNEFCYGVYSNAYSPDGFAIGIYAKGAKTGATNGWSIGGQFEATDYNATHETIGVKCVASGGSNNYCFQGNDGTQGLNKVLTCVTADGKAQWKDISTITTFIPDLKGHETFRGVNFSNNSTTDVTSGGVTLSTSASTIARSVSTTNYATKQIRKGYYASVVSTGRYTGVRGSALLWYVGGGFKYVCEFYVSDTAFGSGCRQFYGMAGQTTDLGYTDTILVSSLLNVIGVGSDSADANLQIFYNDGAGACTKIDLGANFPSNRTAGAVMTTTYSVQIYNAPNTTSINVQVINKETGAISQNTLTSNLPLDTQGLNFFASRTMGTAITNTGQFDLSILGVYSL